MVYASLLDRIIGWLWVPPFIAPKSKLDPPIVVDAAAGVSTSNMLTSLAVVSGGTAIQVNVTNVLSRRFNFSRCTNRMDGKSKNENHNETLVAGKAVQHPSNHMKSPPAWRHDAKKKTENRTGLRLQV